MYSACIDSVKFLFSDKFTMSVANNLGLLESDHNLVGHQSVASGSRKSRSCLGNDRNISGSESDRGEEDDNDGSHGSSRHNQRDEQVYPSRSQAGAAGVA